MIKYYCGNNRNHPSLLDGTKELGTRLDCLQRGMRRGLAEDVDPLFNEPYEPIDPVKKYCGNKEELPENYDRFGGLYECYLKGVGTGKRIKAKRESGDISDISDISDSNDSEGYSFTKNKKNKNFLYINMIILFLLNILSFLIISNFYPDFLYNYTEENKIKYEIKFLNLFLMIFSVSLFSILFLCSY